LLTVVKDLGLRGLYQGAVAIQNGDVSASLAHYFEKSEQVATVTQMDVTVSGDGALATAGGLLFQPLPGANAAALQRVAGNLANLPPLASYMADRTTLEQMMALALAGIDYTVLEQSPLAFSCSCSRARSRQALKVLSEDDLLALIVEGEAVVDCHFCHERYVFSREELAEILDEQERETLAAMFEDNEP
jgi:molecular chaperone Hsp33